MTEAIIVALITGGISLIGTLATTRSSAKSTQALVDYKPDAHDCCGQQLEHHQYHRH